MEVISVKIDNLIQNYCYNFLSYLYAQNGWKRTVFETSKENFIPSYVNDKKIRILISNVGNIIITCYCFSDILPAMEFIYSQFNYGRMGHYLVDTDIKIKYTVTEKYILDEFYYDVETEYKIGGGTIILNGNLATLTYENVEDGKKLYKVFSDVFYSEKNEEIRGIEDEKIEEFENIEKIEDEEVEEIRETDCILQKNEENVCISQKNEENVCILQKNEENAEKYLYSFLMFFSMIKLMEFV